jgi:putative heme-binding domain-containing protein
MKLRSLCALGFGLALLVSPFFLQAAEADPEAEKIAIQVEALSRLKGVDLESNPAMKGAVLRILAKTKGRPQFVELVRDFKLEGQEKELLDYALKNPSTSSGVEALKLVIANGKLDLLEEALRGKNAVAAIEAAGNAQEKQLGPLLRNALLSSKDPSVRKEATRALAKSQDGARALLELARNNTLPSDVKLLASSELNFSPWPAIKKEAADLLPLPQGQNAEPLPPISQLAKRKGSVENGRKVFFSEIASCSHCHQINGQGADFGPKLSEIGTKLGKDALYEAILDPSAGISFGFEAWQFELKNGDEAFGLMTSETADDVSVKTQNGIVTKYKKADVAKSQKMTASIMPAGLQLTMSTQELVDLVEFLSSLKKSDAAEAAPSK